LVVVVTHPHLLYEPERPIMRRVFLGALVVATLAASSAASNGALAVEAGARPDAGNAPASKPARSAKPKRMAVPLSAYDIHSTELPAASIHSKPPSSPQSSWTGTYIGVGAGAGAGAGN
jgi:hypothetical protein